MKDAIKGGIAIVVVVAGVSAAAVCGQHRAMNAAPLPPVQQRAQLRCQEDEDIVITLGPDSLPFAWCMQVLER